MLWRLISSSLGTRHVILTLFNFSFRKTSKGKENMGYAVTQMWSAFILYLFPSPL